MKSLLIIAIIASLFIFSAAQQEVEQALAKELYEQLMNRKCGAVLNVYRKFFTKLPANFQDRVKEELTVAIMQTFPNLDYEKVVKTVNDLFDPNTPADAACSNFEGMLREEINKRRLCFKKCVTEINLSWERVLATLLKCKNKYECYINEIKEEMYKLEGCLMNCISTSDRAVLSNFFSDVKSLIQ